MRRADRLFRIIQILRRRRRPVTASAIAEELETSLRTVYRDIAELLAQRIPIRGEAGVGYVLESGFDMPPLMLTPAEVEAAMLGAQWVMGRGDAELACAAADLIAKLASVVPEPLRPLIIDPALTTVSWTPQNADRIDMVGLRAAIHAQTKVRLRYRDEFGGETERMIWPIAISYQDINRILIAWCELRQALRHFRTDRVVEAFFTDERYPVPRARLRVQWRNEMEKSCSKGTAPPRDKRVRASAP